MKLIRCHPSLWEHVKHLHYSPDTFNRAARCYRAVEDGRQVGFVASLPMPSGTLTKAWRAHKTVVLLPLDHPRQKELWALVADEQANMHVREGHRFFSTAPIAYAEYRDKPDSGWKQTSKYVSRKLKRGEGSHEFVPSLTDDDYENFAETECEAAVDESKPRGYNMTGLTFRRQPASSALTPKPEPLQLVTI
jgi:hypothetical protein